MPDQPTPPQPSPDDQTTEFSAADDASTQQQATAFSAPPAAEPKVPWARKPLHLTRAVATGTAAGILLVGGVAGLAIGATLAGDDSDDQRPGRIGWHVDRGELPERGQGDWREQGPPPGFDQGGPESAPTDPSDGTT